jgi:hypothetical protein
MAGWGLGMGLALWRHATSQLRIERRHSVRPGRDPGLADRPVPGHPGDVQRRADGWGPSFRRRYSIRVARPRRSPEALIDAVARDPNVAAPFEVGRFVKTAGRLGEMCEGDEYLVWMPGPWNGPVRVADRSPHSFRLATLDGHMEAGEIEFRAREDDGALVFEIESAARSGSRPFGLVYGPLRVAREAQLYMWAQFCRTVASMAGGEPGPVVVETLVYPDDHG